MIERIIILILFIISVALVSGCGSTTHKAKKLENTSRELTWWDRPDVQALMNRAPRYSSQDVGSGYRYRVPISSENSSSGRVVINNPCNCVGYSGVGGPAYAGVGGPAYAGVGGRCYAGVGGREYSGVGGSAYSGVGGPRYSGVGGPAYDGVGGPAYSGVGGPCYAGVGGPCYAGVGGGWSCPSICK